MAERKTSRKPPYVGRMPTDMELAKLADKAARKVLGKPNKGEIVTSTEMQTTATRQEISNIIRESLYWYNKPLVRTDEECAERLNEFFTTVVSAGMTPTYEKLCLALGTYREVVDKWVRGDLGETRSLMLKKAKQILADMDATLVSQGKIPQVTYIFRSKNFYGMQDKQEVVLTPNNQLEGASKAELEQKYLEGIVSD